MGVDPWFERTPDGASEQTQGRSQSNCSKISQRISCLKLVTKKSNTCGINGEQGNQFPEKIKHLRCKNSAKFVNGLRGMHCGTVMNWKRIDLSTPDRMSSQRQQDAYVFGDRRFSV
ncbi:hypothetical protein CEXT_427741 [Caerostris extrusa]|uniref:Uncharacterized protein n=1 Tax=Caerostris extrusa TaxID=172846 RepID=A0AAV4NA02_CAEEX|nr:hypothetical protein CEXT_427741 [Caerostris extrusa]